MEPGLRCLIRALQSGSVKVQWNACYAVGAVLRCRRAAAAAWQAGLLGQLLHQLLQTLKHSSNFKASTQLTVGCPSLHWCTRSAHKQYITYCEDAPV